MRNARCFLILILFLVLCSCTPKQAPIPPTPDIADVAPEELDKVLTDPWPDLDENIELTDAEREALSSLYEIQFSLDDEARRQVQAQFLFFNRKARSSVEKWLVRAKLYLPNVRKVLKEKGLPEDLAYLPFVESGYNPNAYSHAGAGGMWQFIPSTGKHFGLNVDWWVDERRNPIMATEAAAEYLNELHTMFNDWSLALAAYNCGEAKIDKCVKSTGSCNIFELSCNNDSLNDKARLKNETLIYVPRFIALVKLISNHELLGFTPTDFSTVPELESIPVKPGTDLYSLAENSGLGWDSFQHLNPGFRRFISPPDRESFVLVPKENKEKAVAFLESPDATPYNGFTVYTIKQGDTWSHIASRFGVPVSVLKRVNKKTSNLIKPGQQVMVPKTSEMMAAATNMERGSGQTAEKAAPPVADTKPNQGPKSSQPANYTIQSGDTLYSIAQKYDISTDELKRINNITSPKSLKPGQGLHIPKPKEQETANRPQKADTLKAAKTPEPGEPLRVYKVQSGDTVWSIAGKFHVSPDKLLQWNNLSKQSVLQPGDTLNMYFD